MPFQDISLVLLLISSVSLVVIVGLVVFIGVVVIRLFGSVYRSKQRLSGDAPRY